MCRPYLFHDTIVTEFKLQSRCYIHIQTNIFETSINTIIPITMGLIVPLLFFFSSDKKQK